MSRRRTRRRSGAAFVEVKVSLEGRVVARGHKVR